MLSGFLRQKSEVLRVSYSRVTLMADLTVEWNANEILAFICLLTLHFGPLQQAILQLSIGLGRYKHYLKHKNNETAFENFPYHNSVLAWEDIFGPRTMRLPL